MSWKLRNISDVQLNIIVQQAKSFADVMRALGMHGNGSRGAVQRRLAAMNTDHFSYVGSGWNKGLTIETSTIVAKMAQNTAQTKRLVPCKHTRETREKLSLLASGRSFGNNVRVKWHTVINVFTGEAIKVQGTWEKRYAEWLNASNVRWERPKTTFTWTRSGDDITHVYHPDFYLPNSDTYVEIKGFMWKDDGKRIDDKLKLKLVIEQNPKLKLQILMRGDLQKLGIV